MNSWPGALGAAKMAATSNQHGVGIVLQVDSHPWFGVGLTRSNAGTIEAVLQDKGTNTQGACRIAARVRIMDVLQAKSTAAVVQDHTEGCRNPAADPRDALVGGLSMAGTERSAEWELPMGACLLPYAMTKHSAEASCCHAKLLKGTSPLLHGQCLDPAKLCLGGTNQVGTSPMGATAEWSRGGPSCRLPKLCNAESAEHCNHNQWHERSVCAGPVSSLSRCGVL